MPRGIELVGAFVDNAAAAGAQAMAALAGQSLQVRAANGQTAVTLEGLITSFTDAGELRVRSPRMHDDVNAIRIAAPAALTEIAALEGFAQPLFSQDLLTVEAFFDAAATAGHFSVAGLLVDYDDLPGISGNYRTWAEVQPNIVDYLTVPVDPTSGQGAWGAGVAINSQVDVFKANTLYALLGVHAQSGRGLWSIMGTDVGNLQVGGAYGVNPIDERAWFKKLSDITGKGCIPVFNSQNKGATLVQTTSDAAAGSAFLSLIFAQLSS